MERRLYARATTDVEQSKYPCMAARGPRAGAALPEYFKYIERYLVPAGNQGGCGGCWAFAVLAMLADRKSIRTGGLDRTQLSAQEVLACNGAGHGCHGGKVDTAVDYVMERGVVAEGRMPYREAGARGATGEAPCPRHAPKMYAVKGSARSLCDGGGQNVANMKWEIYTNGPVVATMDVYSDLYDWDGRSVYEVSPGATVVGGHAVEIIGWADAGANTGEPGMGGPYWICRNSWGRGGRLNVRMGNNTARLEATATSVEPRMPGSSRRPDAKVSYASYREYLRDLERENFLGPKYNYGLAGPVRYGGPRAAPSDRWLAISPARFAAFYVLLFALVSLGNMVKGSRDK